VHLREGGGLRGAHRLVDVLELDEDVLVHLAPREPLLARRGVEILPAHGRPPGGRAARVRSCARLFCARGIWCARAYLSARQHVRRALRPRGRGVSGVLRCACGRGVPGAPRGAARRGAALPERVHHDLHAERRLPDGALGAGVRGGRLDALRARELGGRGARAGGARAQQRAPAEDLQRRGLRAQARRAAGDRGLRVRAPHHRGTRAQSRGARAQSRGARAPPRGARRALRAAARVLPRGRGLLRLRDVALPRVLAPPEHARGRRLRSGCSSRARC
jgi:hypothetical protein